MKERVLLLDLKGAVEAFVAIRWKFFHVEEDRKIVKVEVPRGVGESYVTELRYHEERDLETVVDELFGAGFIEQEIRITSDW